jgi:hypothetical protein
MIPTLSRGLSRRLLLVPTRRLGGLSQRHASTRLFTHSAVSRNFISSKDALSDNSKAIAETSGHPKPEHAVISTFDLFSIGGMITQLRGMYVI